MSPEKNIEEWLAQRLARMNAISGVCISVQEKADLPVRDAHNADQGFSTDLHRKAKTDDSHAPRLRAA
jgi:hypothetical protein